MKVRTTVILTTTLVLIATGLTVVFGTGIGKWDVPGQARRFDSQMARAASHGLPMTQADLLKAGRDSTSGVAENVRNAISKFENQANVQFGNLNYRLTRPDKYRECFDYLDQNREVLDELVQLSDAEEWGDNLDLDENGFLGRDVVYGDMDFMSDALISRARIRLASGDRSGAFDDLRAVWNYAGLLANHHSVEGQRIAARMSHKATEVVLPSIHQYRDDAEFLSQLRGLIQETAFELNEQLVLDANFYGSFVGARASKVTTNKYFSQFPLSYNFPEGSPEPEGQVQEAVMTPIAALYADLYDRHGKDYPLPEEFYKDMSARFAAMSTFSETLALNNRFPARHYYVMRTQIVRTRAVMDAALDVAIFRAQEGRLPEGLDPRHVDPVDNSNLLKYEVDGNGFAVLCDIGVAPTWDRQLSPGYGLEYRFEELKFGE